MNKPVAYWDGKHFASKDKSSLADIPLYTHPAKELTDEEIESLGHEHLEVEFFDEGEYGTEWNIYGMVDFAKAILRKAQEK